MCGRYTTVSRIESIEKRFDARIEKPGLYMPNPNVSPGERAIVITSDRPDTIQLLRFGMTPFWANKRMYLINARLEGDHNSENDPNYRGAKGILNKPAFRKPIRQQRCLVIADGFIEGPEKEKLSKPYYVHLRAESKLFAFAGIWDHWADPSTGEIVYSFAILTTIPNKLLSKIGHHRSPVILSEEMERQWLSLDSPIDELLTQIQPYPEDKMNAWPISIDIKKSGCKRMDILQPIGDPIFKQFDFHVFKEIKLQGMGQSPARARRIKEE